MVDFTTTKIDPNAPGLTYQTPKAMPAKFSNVGAAVSVLDKGIQGAVALDKSMTLTEAQQLAEEEAQAYKEGSLTSQQMLQQQKMQAETDLANASVQDKPQFQEDLDNINNQLIKAKEQGLISPAEFKMRIMQRTSELAEANPAYGNEISAKVSQVLGYTGVSDLISMDESYVKAQQDAQNKQMEEIDSVLKENKFPTVGIDPETKFAQYQNITKISQRVSELKILSESNESINAYEFEAEINADGGLYKLGGEIMDQYYAKANLIANDPLKTDKEKMAEHIQLVTEARKVLSTTVARLPEKQKYKDYLASSTSILDKLEEDLEKVLDGTFEKNHFGNQAAIAKSVAELRERAAGRAPETIDSMTKIISALDGLLENKRFTKDANAITLLDSYTKRLLDAIDSGGKTANPRYSYNDTYLQDNLTGNLPTLNKKALEILDDGENLDALGAMYNDILLQNELITNPDNRLTDLDQRLSKLSNTTDPKVFENLMTANPDFGRKSGEAINFYRKGILQEIATFEDVQGRLLVDKNSGLIRTSDLTDSLGSIPARLNVLIKYESKLLGKNPGEHAEEVINSLFNASIVNNDSDIIDFNDLDN